MPDYVTEQKSKYKSINTQKIRELDKSILSQEVQFDGEKYPLATIDRPKGFLSTMMPKSVRRKGSAITGFFKHSKRADDALTAPISTMKTKEEVTVNTESDDLYGFYENKFMPNSLKSTFDKKDEDMKFLEKYLLNWGKYSKNMRKMINSLYTYLNADENNAQSTIEKLHLRNVESSLAENIYVELRTFKNAMKFMASPSKDEEKNAEKKEKYEKELAKYSETEREALLEIADRFVEGFCGSMEVGTENVVDVSGVKYEKECTINYDKRCKDEKGQVHNLELKNVTKTPLFTHKPNIRDLTQGNVGDCFLIAALGSIVNTDPDFITKNMKDLGSSVAVRFWPDNKPVTVIVKKTIPCFNSIPDANGNPTLLGAEESPIWVNIYEKAFAMAYSGRIKGCELISALPKYKGHAEEGQNPYYALENGGHLSDAINFITGREFKNKNSDPIYKRYKGVNIEKLYFKTKSLKDLLKLTAKNIKQDYKDNKEVNKPTFDEYQAKELFGITNLNLKQNRELRNFFKNPSLIVDYYSQALENLVKDRFTDTNFHSFADFYTAINEIDWKTLPDIPGISDDKQKEAKQKLLLKILRTVHNSQTLMGHDHDLEGKGAYTSKEKSLFNKIEKAINNKKFVDITFNRTPKILYKKGSNHKGRSENTFNGLAIMHAYSVIGVRKIQEKVDSKNRPLYRYFIQFKNPWSDFIRLYNKAHSGIVQSVRNTSKDDEQIRQITKDGKQINIRTEHFDSHGEFEMELRDMISSSEEYVIEK